MDHRCLGTKWMVGYFLGQKMQIVAFARDIDNNAHLHSASEKHHMLNTFSV